MPSIMDLLNMAAGKPMSGEKPGGKPRPKKTIVIADSNPEMRTLMRKMISTEYSPRFLEAEDGNAVVDLVFNRESPPDMVIMELDLPNVNGTRTLKNIRGTYSNDQLPVIICSASSDKAMIANLIKLGISDYILKPFNAEHFLERVKAAFEASAKAKLTNLPGGLGRI